eukprot:CAMPEP_0198431888 /NCGR_PEP_ID=MMETSP1452-20131203/20885_1 /TAXON_ID=1181717 /ORGANISM="Synchroma pusillum, Strain CCMP3072" /LENGTH=104 /DNA_ID=CAMNT_0044152359 /DNA_START=1 /DNA_END=312 /DNA_ORIENTATION=+
MAAAAAPSTSLGVIISGGSAAHPRMTASEPRGCTSCGSWDVVTDLAAGDVVCRGCGLVLGERCINDEPEWRNLADDRGGADPCRAARVDDLVHRDGTDQTTIQL